MGLKRLRRNRKTAAIRDLCAQTQLMPSDLIMPYFLLPGENRHEEIATFPGIAHQSVDHVIRSATKLYEKGMRACAVFPVMQKSEKDPLGSCGFGKNNPIAAAVKALKKELPDLAIVADIALDPFTDHGHDGVLDSFGYVDNDKTVALLAKLSILYAESGADFVAPSATMDGRILAIRKALDEAGFYNTSIISYTAKYASALYGPFRDAVGSALKNGNKLSYQLNPANFSEALLEAAVEEAEGADILMVKPALYYLDVIAKMKERTDLPIAAYHVSGEYAMVMAAHEKGYLDAEKVFLEALLSIKRAGANMIFSYATEMLLNRKPHFSVAPPLSY